MDVIFEKRIFLSFQNMNLHKVAGFKFFPGKNSESNQTFMKETGIMNSISVYQLLWLNFSSSFMVKRRILHEKVSKFVKEMAWNAVNENYVIKTIKK